MDLIFARAFPAQREEVERVLRAAFAPYVRKLGRELTPASYDWLGAALEEGRVYTAARHGTLVGVAATARRGQELVIDQVAVDPAQQGRGAGSSLLARMEEAAREAGCRALSLDTAAMMDGLLRLYARCGFAETRRGPPTHGKDPHPRVYLSKPI